MSVQRVFRGRAFRATSTHASASTEPSPGVRAKGSPPTTTLAPRAGFVLTLQTLAIEALKNGTTTSSGGVHQSIPLKCSLTEDVGNSTQYDMICGGDSLNYFISLIHVNTSG
jgi:hypothetical protein